MNISVPGIFLLVVMAVMAVSGPAEESFLAGQVDWLKGTIRATGVAYPPAKKVEAAVTPEKMMSIAKVSAQQNLLETIKQLRVSSARRVETLVGSDPSFMAKIQELVKNAPVIEQRYLSDGTLWITIGFRLWGAFSQLVLPPEIKPIDPITPTDPALKKGPVKSESPGWTGLIIDARGLDLNPALVPSVFDDRGDPVYGPGFINRDFAVQWGMCAYAVALDQALNNNRIGRNPLTVKGIRIIGPGNTDIVISAADAGRIRAAAEHVVILREGRVVVVTDQIESVMTDKIQ